MKTKMNKMIKISIKSRFINNIALTLVLFMTVFVACQKEVGIVPNPSPAAKSGVANNKEVTFNPGIYDQAAGDPLFTAYYEATMQLQAPLYNKMREGSMDKHLGFLEAAIENNNLGQVAELMGYESLDCYMATVATLQAAASKLFEKYPSIHPDNAGVFELVVDVFFEKYESNITNPAARLGGSNSLLAGRCGSNCSYPEIPDWTCCYEKMQACKLAIKRCRSDFAQAMAVCWADMLSETIPNPITFNICVVNATINSIKCINRAVEDRDKLMPDCCIHIEDEIDEPDLEIDDFNDGP